MNRLALGFFFVALEAFLRVGVWLERNRMDRGPSLPCYQSEQGNQNPDIHARCAAAVLGDRLAEPRAAREQIHGDSEACRCKIIAVSRTNGPVSQCVPNLLRKRKLEGLVYPGRNLQIVI